jgi:hypothetical protein
MGKTLPAVKFNLRELVDQEVEGHLELEYDGSEVYAEGIGLFSYRKNISGEMQIAYRLEAVYDLPAFEQKFKTRLSQE